MSEFINVEVKVAKETHEAVSGLVKFVAAAKGAADDGWNAGDDIPVVLNSLMAELIPALQGVTLIPDEFADHPSEFVAALTASIPELAAIFLKRKEK